MQYQVFIGNLYVLTLNWEMGNLKNKVFDTVLSTYDVEYIVIVCEYAFNVIISIKHVLCSLFYTCMM